MDVQATKHASAVPAASTASTGRHPVAVVPAPEAPPPVVSEAPRPQPTAYNLLQTQQAIAEQVSRYLQSTNRNLEFQVDGESGTAVIVVRDGEGNVIRRIPGEEALQLMRRLNAESGTLVDSVA